MKKLLGFSLLTLATLGFSKTIDTTFQIINPTNLKNSKTNQQQKTIQKDVSNIIDYNFFEFYYSTSLENSSVYTLLNWKKYADNWEDFKSKYPIFSVSGLIVAGFQGWYPIRSHNLGVAHTQNLPFSQSQAKSVFYVVNSYGDNLYTNIFLNWWYDDNNICFQWKAILGGNIINFVAVQVSTVVFKAA